MCSVFEVTRSCYYAYCRKRRSPDPERVILRSRETELLTQSRSAAGSRSIMLMMKEDGMQIGRFKVRKLMREMNLISKQPGSHATVERVDIPNVFDRAFSVASPNKVWCSDITYVWAEGRWHYLAAVIDLYARRVVGWAISAKPEARHWILPVSSVAELRMCCFTAIRTANTGAGVFARDYGDTASLSDETCPAT